MARAMTEREQRQGRIAAASLNGGPASVTPRGENRYTVTGRAGDRYTVLVRGSYAVPESYSCDCQARTNCWHQAAVWLLHVSAAALVAA